MIRSLLTNKKYCGDTVLQKSVTVDCIGKIRQKNDGVAAPMYYVQDSHPAIVSRSDFYRAHAEFARHKASAPKTTQNTVTASGKYSKHALSDVLICGECGTRYQRCTWPSHGNKRIVWRCISRLEHGKKYCQTSPTVPEEELQAAVVRTLNRFNAEHRDTYLNLMKATIDEALGLKGNNEEVAGLRQRMNSLNAKMMEMVAQSIQEGKEIEDNEGEFTKISETIGILKNRLTAIEESSNSEMEYKIRLARIQEIMDNRKSQPLRL